MSEFISVKILTPYTVGAGYGNDIRYDLQTALIARGSIESITFSTRCFVGVMGSVSEIRTTAGNIYFAPIAVVDFEPLLNPPAATEDHDDAP